jgi:hypothetical protein
MLVGIKVAVAQGIKKQMRIDITCKLIIIISVLKIIYSSVYINTHILDIILYFRLKKLWASSSAKTPSTNEPTKGL